MFLLMGVFGLRYKKIGETTICCFPVFFFYGQRYVKILNSFLNNTVKRHEEMIKGLALNISELQTEIEYMNELINALSESVENNYFIN